MDYLLPLTIIGLIISLYQISEDHVKRNYKFKFGFCERWGLLILSILLIVLIVLSNYWAERIVIFNVYSVSTVTTYGSYTVTNSFLSSLAAFLIALIIFMILYLKLKSKSI